MIIQVQHILNLPVILENGKRAGKVRDIWFDEFWTMTAIVLDARVWFRKAAKVVSWDDVISCEHDALLIRNDAIITTVDKKQLLRTFHSGVVSIKDMPVYTKEGQYLGEVADVYFKKSKGTQVIGYELTDGFLADLMQGRRRLFLPEGPDEVTLGEDAIMVPVSFERVLEKDHTWKVTGEDG
ncbi:PRC-barrel domain-containing protein [Cohnella kolymensis]|uniref:PRC-barrel domain-containing protein n=1 Tax=Cohnella kolymensis TaxID=1590652 RepID=UPI000696FA7A|nr:PRC-barrel domain-containing protein [Cohnella kolymensis]